MRGLIALGMTILALLPLAASAHEHRDVADGQYQLVVGFLDEPAFSGLKNGLDLRVSKVDPTATPSAEGGEAGLTPVEGLDLTLQAEVIFGDQTMALPLSPQWGEPGAYASHFFPTQVGDYSFHIWGTIEGVSIDETFTSGPDTFGPMEDPAPLQFPKPAAAAGGDAVTTATIGGGSNEGGLTGSPLAVSIVGVGLAGALGLRRWVASHRAAAVR